MHVSQLHRPERPCHARHLTRRTRNHPGRSTPQAGRPGDSCSGRPRRTSGPARPVGAPSRAQTNGCRTSVGTPRPPSLRAGLAFCAAVTKLAALGARDLRADAEALRRVTYADTCYPGATRTSFVETIDLPCAERERLNRRCDRVGRSAVLLEAVRRTEPTRSLRQVKGTTSSVPTQGEWFRVVQATARDAHACLRDVQRCRLCEADALNRWFRRRRKGLQA